MNYVQYAESSQYYGEEGSRLAYHLTGTGPVCLFIHGYPTWSWDWQEVTSHLKDRTILTPDLLGFGWSDKPKQEYSIAQQADLIMGLLRHLEITKLSIVAHDYGTIVLQELLDRKLSIERIALLNGGIAYSAYRPILIQRALRIPYLGAIVALLMTKPRIHAALSKILSRPLSDAEFEGLWHGIHAYDGDWILRDLLRYNDERAIHHVRWEDALANYTGPKQFVWGTDDPISGGHVLEVARKRSLDAEYVELQGVGHYPQLEAPERVAAALDRFLPKS